DADDAAQDAYADALESWLALGGADLDERLEATAAEVGLGIDLDREVSTLSGGQAARVGLAGLLLSRYDAYLLD
ncbi:ATP-binding cassette domain-containing protein, partial [Acinetobacter baumannii]|nr:ATP-binding cassette domain-containing protein [Acinetobacter baumannii]